MDPMFLIWLVISTAVFFTGLFIYRKALRLQTNAGFEQMISNVNELKAPEESADKDEEIRLFKAEQDKLREQLAQEKKYCEQTADDYRNQLRNLGRILDQSKSDYEIVIHEKEIAVNRLMKEKEELAVDHDALSLDSKTLKQNLEQLEVANRNLEDKEQQVQYELVKSRAQFLGLERMCEELKKKIEQLMAVEKK